MFEIKDEFRSRITNPEKIKYINRPIDNGYIDIIVGSKVKKAKLLKDEFGVQGLSISPDDIHIVAYCHGILEESTNSISPDRYHYYVLRKNYSNNGDKYFEVIDLFEDPDDTCIQWFARGFEWYPEYGFVKMIVKT